MIKRVDSAKVMRQYRRMQYTIADMRDQEGITIKGLLEQSGIGEGAWKGAAYGVGGTNIINVMEVLAAFGYRLQIVEEESE